MNSTHWICKPVPDQRETNSPNEWLAAELHDGLLQWVVAARLQLEAIVGQADAPMAQSLQPPLQYLTFALDDARALIGMIESQSDDPGISLAVRLAECVTRLRPLAASRDQQLRFEPPACDFPKLSHKVEWSVFRIALQAIHNAITHAGPAEVTVELNWETAGDCDGNDAQVQQLILSVTDTGVGFDAPRTRSKALANGHLGLISMTHRAAACGGVLHWHTAPGQGCQTRLSVPLVASSS